jgi:CheY-like chemotaxis protein
VIDGVELARQIRADPRFGQMRLLLSSSAGTVDLAEARRLGFDAAEEKPALRRHLINALCALIDDTPGVGRNAQNGAADPIGTDSARILLVEDNQIGQQLALEMLSRGRYRVDMVADGLEAVSAVAKLPYDLILMDIRMPIMGGVEATRRIRAMGGAAGRIPVIALTANVLTEDVAEYYATGMQNVVEKPVDAEILLAAVDAALDAGPEAVGGSDERVVRPQTGAG